MTPQDDALFFQRWSRQLVLPEVGVQGQRRLEQAAFAVFGCSAAAKKSALALKRSGVGRVFFSETFDKTDYSSDFDLIFPSPTTPLGRDLVRSEKPKLFVFAYGKAGAVFFQKGGECPCWGCYVSWNPKIDVFFDAFHQDFTGVWAAQEAAVRFLKRFEDSSSLCLYTLEGETLRFSVAPSRKCFFQLEQQGLPV